MTDIGGKFDTFLAELLETDGPEGVVECFQFLFGAFEISKDGIVIGANQDFLDMSHYSRAELCGMKVLDLIADEEREAMVRRLSQGNTERYELRLLLKNKAVLDVVVSPRIFYARGERYCLAEFIDNSEQKKSKINLQESEKKFHSVFEQAAVGIALVSITGTFLEVNQKLCDILGYSKAQLMGKTFQEITHPDDVDADIRSLGQMLRKERQTYNIEKRYFDKNGQIIWIDLTVSLVSSTQGEPKYFVAVIDNINYRKEIERELIDRATHDSLTGLLNRAELDKALETETTRADRYERPLSLLMLDIDHFKFVNDDFGHQAGDKVLVELAKILELATRKVDSVGRFGGEEFLVILPELNHEQALMLAERIRRQVESTSIRYQDKQIEITVSIGVSTYPQHGVSVDDLVKASDDAMYKAKKRGRNQIASA